MIAARIITHGVIAATIALITAANIGASGEASPIKPYRMAVKYVRIENRVSTKNEESYSITRTYTGVINKVWLHTNWFNDPRLFVVANKKLPNFNAGARSLPQGTFKLVYEFDSPSCAKTHTGTVRGSVSVASGGVVSVFDDRPVAPSCGRYPPDAIPVEGYRVGRMLLDARHNQFRVNALPASFAQNLRNGRHAKLEMRFSGVPDSVSGGSTAPGAGQPCPTGYESCSVMSGEYVLVFTPLRL